MAVSTEEIAEKIRQLATKVPTVPEFQGVDVPSVPEFATPGPQIFPSLDNQDLYVGNIEAFFNQFEHSFRTNTVLSNLYTKVVRDQREIIEPSPELNDEQVGLLNKENPGLDVARGTKQNVADLILKNFNADKRFERIAAASNPTWDGWLANASGAFFGAVADPTSIAIAALAPELIGIKRVETATSLADVALTRAKRGFVEGAAFGAAEEGGIKARDNALDQNYDGIAGAMSIANNAFMGGILHPLGGMVWDKVSAKNTRRFKKGIQPIGPEAAEQLNETAVSQVLNGKDVSIEAPLQQAMANQAKKLFNELDTDAESITNLTTAIFEGHDRTVDKLKSSNERLGSLRAEIKEKGEAPERTEQLIKLEEENLDLSDQDRSYEVVKSFMEDTPQNVSPAGFDEYIKNVSTPEGNFKHGDGNTPFEIEGEEIENPTTLVEQAFPDDYKESLLKNVPLDENDRVALDKAKTINKRLSKFEKMVKVATDCLSGS